MYDSSNDSRPIDSDHRAALLYKLVTDRDGRFVSIWDAQVFLEEQTSKKEKEANIRNTMIKLSGLTGVSYEGDKFRYESAATRAAREAQEREALKAKLAKEIQEAYVKLESHKAAIAALEAEYQELENPRNNRPVGLNQSVGN